jgi:methionine-rich copper-binding protein CopC
LRGLTLLVAVIFASCVTAGVVSAHANLDSSDPPKDARLAQAPAAMTLRFTQGLKPDGSFVQVAGADGVNRVSAFTFDPADAKVMRATLQPLQPGVYTVKYQSLSADDDDYHDGTYQFTVLNPDGTDPGAAPSPGQLSGDEDDGSSSTTTIIAVVAAVVLVGGALMFALRFKRNPA